MLFMTGLPVDRARADPVHSRRLHIAVVGGVSEIPLADHGDRELLPSRRRCPGSTATSAVSRLRVSTGIEPVSPPRESCLRGCGDRSQPNQPQW